MVPLKNIEPSLGCLFQRRLGSPIRLPFGGGWAAAAFAWAASPGDKWDCWDFWGEAGMNRWTDWMGFVDMKRIRKICREWWSTNQLRQPTSKENLMRCFAILHTINGFATWDDRKPPWHQPAKRLTSQLVHLAARILRRRWSCKKCQRRQKSPQSHLPLQRRKKVTERRLPQLRPSTRHLIDDGLKPSLLRRRSVACWKQLRRSSDDRKSQCPEETEIPWLLLNACARRGIRCGAFKCFNAQRAQAVQTENILTGEVHCESELLQLNMFLSDVAREKCFFQDVSSLQNFSSAKIVGLCKSQSITFATNIVAVGSAMPQDPEVEKDQKKSKAWFLFQAMREVAGNETHEEQEAPNEKEVDSATTASPTKKARSIFGGDVGSAAKPKASSEQEMSVAFARSRGVSEGLERKSWLAAATNQLYQVGFFFWDRAVQTVLSHWKIAQRGWFLRLRKKCDVYL